RRYAVAPPSVSHKEQEKKPLKIFPNRDSFRPSRQRMHGIAADR
ncbi:hypothetical protein TNCV_3335371, partial [Trichonephila clavipes]